MDSPRGRIYLMRAFDEGRAKITDSFVEHMFRCLDCRACETACPSGVHFGHMMEEMRGKIVEERPAHWIARLDSESRVSLIRGDFILQLATAAVVSGVGHPELRQSDGSPETDCATNGGGRSADAGGRNRERRCARTAAIRAEGKKQGTVAFFTGCVMNSMMGSINKASVRLLTAAGYDVMVPGEQICCGALANHAGLRDTAKDDGASQHRGISGRATGRHHY